MHVSPATQALSKASQIVDEWLGNAASSAPALSQAQAPLQLRDQVLARVRDLMQQESPAAANRRWLCELVRGWAPLEALFGSAAAEFAPHLDLLVEHEFGHLLAESGSTSTVCEQLQAEQHSLALEIKVASALHAILEPGSDAAGAWIGEFTDMSLALADYLHRCAVDLPQRIPDAMAHYYTTRIANIQRDIRDECLTVRRRQRGA
jgi:hypothetical protein